MITVKNLIEELQKLPQNLKVIVSSDPEGNSFNNLQGVDLTHYDGEFILDKEDLQEYIDDDFDEIEEVVVLWP